MMMMDNGDRQDANVDAYDERILDDNLRGILQVSRDFSTPKPIAAPTVHLHEGTWPVANYDSGQVARQFMDVVV